MELTLNENGELVGQDGKLFEANGETVTVTGAKRQEDVDRAFQAEKAKHKERIDSLTSRIKALEAQEGRSAEVQRMLDEARQEKAEMEQRLSDAEKQAESKVAEQLRKAQSERDKLNADLEQERSGRVRDQVTNQLLSASKDRFNDPAMDIVPHLLSSHKREPKKDAEGKDTGEFVDLFKLTHKGEDGKEITDFYTADKALEIWAQSHPHHVRPLENYGSGGGGYQNKSNGGGEQVGFTYNKM